MSIINIMYGTYIKRARTRRKPHRENIAARQKNSTRQPSLMCALYMRLGFLSWGIFREDI